MRRDEHQRSPFYVLRFGITCCRENPHLLIGDGWCCTPSRLRQKWWRDQAARGSPRFFHGPSHTYTTSNSLGGAGSYESWLKQKEQEKVDKYGSAQRRRVCRMVPLVLDSFKGVGPEGRRLLQLLIKGQIGQFPRGCARQLQASL